MRPVVIFRHARCEGAGYLGTFLERNAIPWCEVRIDKDEAVPDAIEAFSGLVLMGGPMSVNDDLPWIPPLLGLIRQAVERDVPVLGHCLGGQLMSKALGGVVSRNPVKEIGWGQVSIADHPAAKHWFGEIDSFESFHWHGETFTIPPGATPIMSSAHCQNQAYTLGKHLGFQCHIEMTEEMVKKWCECGRDEVAEAIHSPGVQSIEDMHQQLAERVSVLQKIADQVYAKWIQGLVLA